MVMNRGAASQVYATSTAATAYDENAGVATANLAMAINTAANVALTVNLQIAANTDYLILESYAVEAFYGD
jgi:hypothetical protein